MKLNYCPECKADLHAESKTKYVCENGHPYWNNPRCCTCVVLLKGDQALFSKRGRDPFKDKYDFPGGFVDYGENAWEAAVREIREETGLTIAAGDLTMIDSTSQLYEENVTVTDVIFVCSRWEGTMKADDDVAELEWKPITAIDTDEFAWNYAGLTEKLQPYVRQ